MEIDGFSRDRLASSTPVPPGTRFRTDGGIAPSYGNVASGREIQEMFARVAAVLVGSGLAIACASPLPLEGRPCPCLEPGWVCCESACVPRDQAAACSAAPIVPTPPGPTAGPPPRSIEPTAVPDAATTGDAGVSDPLDAPARDATRDGPPDTPAAEEPCQGPVRGCSADQTATRVCQSGRWVFERTCLDGTVCSVGECLCRTGSCEDTVVVRAAANIVRLAVGGNVLYYHKGYTEIDLNGVHQLDLRTNQASTLVSEGPGNNIGSMVADATGALTWCRGPSATQAPALMRGTQLLEPIPCSRLAVSDTHVYFTRADRPGIFRRPLGRAGVEMLSERDPLAFNVAGPYLYYSTDDQEAEPPTESVSVRRVSIGAVQPGREQRVAVATMFFDAALSILAADQSHVYGDDGDGLFWAPLTSDSPLETFWRGPGPQVRGLALSDTHVYFSTDIDGFRGCLGATIWRKSKAAGPEATPMASYPAACVSRDLLLQGEYLYTVIRSAQGGAQVVRLRL
jgi:hypothetical protein